MQKLQHCHSVALDTYNRRIRYGYQVYSGQENIYPQMRWHDYITTEIKRLHMSQRT